MKEKLSEFLFLLTLIQLMGGERFEMPSIGIESFILSDGSAWDEVNPPPMKFVNKTTYIVPPLIMGLALICNGSYPVMWNFHQDLKNMKNTHWKRMVSMSRIVEDFKNPSSYKYQTRLKILGYSNDITGNYTCQSSNNADSSQLSQSIYIFWEGSSPPYLTKAKMDIKVFKTSEIQNSYLIPCKPSNPDIEILLSKQENKTWDILQLNESIVYDPTIGFILNDLPDPTGLYKCFVKEAQEKDYVRIEIQNFAQRDKIPEFNNTMSQEASFNFDTESSRFVCCSNSGKPPLLMLLPCEHPTICALKKYMLLDMENTGYRMNNFPSCAVSRINKRDILANAGVIRCVGDGIDIVREFFFSIENVLAKFNYSAKISPPFFSLDEARDEDLMLLETVSTLTYYSSKEIQIYCSTIPYYFSHGIMWSIEWKNKTRSFHNSAELNLSSNFLLLSVTGSLKISINSTIESVTCYAPLWNSNKWRNKTLIFNLKEPTIPSFLGEINTTVRWNFNETNVTLTCEMSGDPQPTIIWMKNNRTLRGRNYVTQGNGSSQILIPRVSLNMEGEFICVGKNIGGETKRFFRIFVIQTEESNSTLVVILVMCGILSFAFLFILLFLFWKMKYQKEKIRHLARVAFKDVYNKQGAEKNEGPKEEFPQLQHSPAILPIADQDQEGEDGHNGYIKF